MKVIHHNDLDGRGSAYLIYKKYMNELEKTDFIEMSYNTEIPFNKINKNDIVYIVDYSLELEEMRKLINLTNDLNNIIWIDHHESAIEKYNNFEYGLFGVRDKNKSGILLTYNYLFNNENKKVNYFHTTGTPDFVKYINDWDTWAHTLENTVEFRNGMYIESTQPYELIWQKARTEPDKIVHQGRTVSKYKEQWSKEYINDFAFELIFEGYKTIAVNLRKMSSKVFDSIEEDYDIKMLFAYNGSSFKVSIFTDKSYINIAKLAEKYGGGGHKGAGGFYTEDINKIKG